MPQDTVETRIIIVLAPNQLFLELFLMNGINNIKMDSALNKSSTKRASEKNPHREQRTNSPSAPQNRRSSRLSINKPKDIIDDATDDVMGSITRTALTDAEIVKTDAGIEIESGIEIKTGINIDSNESESESENETGIKVDSCTTAEKEIIPTRKRGRPKKCPKPSSPTSTAKQSPAVAPAQRQQRAKRGAINIDATTSHSRSPSSLRKSRSSDIKSKTGNTLDTPLRKSSRSRIVRSLEIQETQPHNGVNGNADNNANDRDHSYPSRSQALKSITTSNGVSTDLPSRALDANWRQVLLQDLQRKVRRKTDPYGFFSKPVDPEEDDCEDYYDTVDRSQAMCFDIMGEMIDDSSKIKNVDQYVKFLLMIVRCAKLYNTDEENFVRKQADLIDSKSEGLIKIARERWADKEGREERERVEANAFERQDRQRSIDSRLRRLETRSRNDSLSSTYVDDEDDDYGISISNAQSTRRRRALQRRNKSRTTTKADDVDGMQRSRRRRSTDIDYNDEEHSIGSLSESDLLKSKDDSKDDGDDDDDGPIEGSEIPFCKPMLAGSAITPCDKREDWLDICPQLAIVCNEAARRSTLRVDHNAKRYEKPLSEIYIKERLEYDDPLEGFIVRTKAEPFHVQGFVLATRFTTWRKTFRWAIDEPAALITPTDHRLHMTDRSGDLTKELQTCERDDSNADQGYKYNSICEISLLGGLGCGRALLSRTMSELRQAQKYEYVVLQSTKIAIPFYEKLGFVRVGAVTRFNDVEMLPEVAYRHWSEIVNGEAVEPSYMMARRLKATHEIESTIVSSKPDQITNEERHHEIHSALASIYSLLSDALTIRIGSVAHTNSFREILSAAREYAISADDYLFVKVIEKALSEFTGSQFGKSKRLLRSELRHGRSNTSDELKRNGFDDIVECSEKEVSDADEIVSITPNLPVETVDVLVSVKVQDCEKEETEYISATVPTDFLARDDIFSVKIIVDGSVIEGNPGIACLSRSHKANKELLEATELAVDNLMTFVCKRSSKTGLGQSQVGIGDEIMVKILAFDKSPLWVETTVKKRAKIQGTAPYFSGNNGFQVEWDEQDSLKRKNRVLDIRNRGVGKDWCTEMDWASFSVLPIAVLDSLLIGSKVNYPAVDGKTVEGVVTKRIGGGLDNELTFRVDIGREKGRGRPRKDDVDYAFEDLSAGAIREAITISDTNIVQTRKLLKSSKFVKQQSRSMADDDDAAQTGKVSKQQKRKTNFQSAEAWAEYRIQEHRLIHISDTEKLKRQKSCSKVDDYIIRLSTGIGSNMKDMNKAGNQSENNNTNVTETDKLAQSGIEIRGRKRKAVSDETCKNPSSTLFEQKQDDQRIKKKRRGMTTDVIKLRRSTRGKNEEQGDE